MKAVTWTDQSGRKRRSLIRDTDGPEKAQYGIPCEPPNIFEEIDWNAIKDEVYGILIDNGITSWQDAQRDQAGFSSACNVLKRHLTSLYKRKAIEDKQTRTT